MANFSTREALTNLTTSIPDWNKRLDDLNGQIAQRQIELARLVEAKPARSLKNKGSTESLRPKDGEETTPPSNEPEKSAETSPKIVESPKPIQNEFPTKPRPESPSAARAAAAAALEYNQSSKPLTPRASPNALTRQSSHPIQPTEPRPPNVLRKRKTESLASGNSQVPKYRTRSMIIVYYDSAVQTAFEELVKFVSGNRNAMRKGKMAAKMAEMRRAAEMEADEESDDESEDDTSTALGSAIPKPSNGLPKPGKIANTNGDSTPNLKFVSTRQMGPSRDRAGRDNIGNTMNMLKGYRRAGGGIGSKPDIFDELDKGLEWCQSQCEHAAHQFLRDGDCSTEIENIKRKLDEVKEAANRKIEKLKVEEEEEIARKGKEKEKKIAKTPKPKIPVEDKMTSVPVIASNESIKLEVDDTIEADDDDDNDVDFDPKKLIFKRSRDVAY